MNKTINGRRPSTPKPRKQPRQTNRSAKSREVSKEDRTVITLLSSIMMAMPVPEFTWEWHDPADHWDLAEQDGQAIAVGAFVGGLIADVHPAWLVATAAIETGYTFNAAARGDGGRSLGLCQIQLATSRQSAPWMTRRLLLDPVTNLVATGLHYRRLIERYGRHGAQAVYGCGFRCSAGFITEGAAKKWFVFWMLTDRVPT